MVSRRRHSFTLRSSFAALVAIGLALGVSAARAAGWQYYDPDCPIALGPSKTMKFVTMQPKKSIERICDALPEAGPSVIALDAPDQELREMNWDIRILREEDDKSEGETLFRLPVEKHRNGMMNFDYDFPSAGKYVLFAKLTSDDGAKEYVGRHRFTVGLLKTFEFYGYIFFFACFLVAAGGGFAARARRKAQGAGAALTPPPP